MSYVRGHEIPTIDCERITLSIPGAPTELVLDTASKIGLTPQIETQDAVKLVIKNQLRSQKPQQNTLTGNTLVITDNVFSPELIVYLQGGTIEYDSVTGKIKRYTPPVAGSTEKGEIFELNAYSAIYGTDAILKGYEKITYPNCQGVPIAPSAEDNVFRVMEYTINSAPAMGQAPYVINYISPDELPVATENPNIPSPLEPTPEAPQITTLTIPDGTVGTPYSETLAATGTEPITWSIASGTLPLGLILTNNIISGTPTTVETAAFDIKASNGTLPDAVQSYSITIH